MKEISSQSKQINTEYMGRLENLPYFCTSHGG
jgi:hypothetical protein